MENMKSIFERIMVFRMSKAEQYVYNIVNNLEVLNIPGYEGSIFYTYKNTLLFEYEMVSNYFYCSGIRYWYPMEEMLEYDSDKIKKLTKFMVERYLLKGKKIKVWRTISSDIDDYLDEHKIDW